ncbi:unnamed protein product [Absidia cylindrospora]
MGTHFFRKVLSCCTFTLNVSPVILLSLIFAWAFWAYHFQLCLYLIQNQAILQGCLYMIFFEPFFGLTVWSFYKAFEHHQGTPSTLRTKGKQHWILNKDTRIMIVNMSNCYQVIYPPATAQVILVRRMPHTTTKATVNKISSPSPSPAILSLDDNNVPIPSASSSSLSITVKRDGAKRYCQKCKMEMQS